MAKEPTVARENGGNGKRGDAVNAVLAEYGYGRSKGPRRNYLGYKVVEQQMDKSLKEGLRTYRSNK